jgi:hypothetical protein
MGSGDFEILPADEMRRKYGLDAEHRPAIRLNARNVPTALRHLIPLAEQFGVADDLIRLDVVRKAPAADVERLRTMVRESEGALMEWLGGPAADGPTYSDEYIAFSTMLRAADEC